MVFGRLTVVSRATNKGRRVAFNCVCQCGQTVQIVAFNLVSGDTKSCGCLVKDTKPNLKHGLCRRNNRHPLYATWRSMKDRCQNPSNEHFSSYGGRGISVCERWDNSFPNFLLDMGDRPTEQHSLDRVDNDAGYSPENCRWATSQDQALNRRQYYKWIIDGVPLVQIAKDRGCNTSTVLRRFKRGVRGEQLFTKRTLDGRTVER